MIRRRRREPRGIAEDFLLRRHEPGAAPGRRISDQLADPTEVTLLHYDAQGVERISAPSLDLIRKSTTEGRAGRRAWIDIVGLRDGEHIGTIAEALGAHPLVIEDILNPGQRPKLESYDERLFVVLQRVASENQGAQREQISLWLAPGVLLTVRELRSPIFEAVTRRLEGPIGRMRRNPPDYLLYALVDSVVDHLMPILEEAGDRLEELESRVLSDNGSGVLRAIYQERRQMLTLRRAIWPLREVLGRLMRDPNPLVTQDTRTFLADVYDHALVAIEFTETGRELVTGLMDLHLSVNGYRMNAVMKMLAIISTLFLPMTLIASVYGMNFERGPLHHNLPELGWRYGYAFALGMMVLTALVLLWWMRRQGFLGEDHALQDREEAATSKRGARKGR